MRETRVSAGDNKMASVLNNCTNVEMRAVVRFLWATGKTVQEIHHEMLPVYGMECLSRKAVYNWVEKFKGGRSNVEDDVRPGRPVEIATDETMKKVDEMIRSDRRITVAHVARSVGCSQGLAYSIIHDRLQFRKVCARWVPRDLTPQHKLNRMGLALEHLCRYEAQGQDMLKKIVTGDESWVHHFQPESKRQSMQWKHPGSPAAKKFKVVSSAGKIMTTVFWDCEGVLLVCFQKHGETVNATSYCAVLRELRDSIRRKRPTLLTDGVLLLHDNARPHVARATQETIRQLNWEVLDHPPYSPDLAPSDFHLFGPLKEHLGGQRFEDDEELKLAVRRWLRQQPQAFYAAGFRKLVQRWDKCINTGGDYVEK